MKKTTTLCAILFFVVSMVSAQATYTIDKTTYSASTVSTTWEFTNGCTVSNNNAKAYSAGTAPYIKFSAVVVFTVKLPAVTNINSVQFMGYNNYNTLNSYISEFNGTTYSATDYVFTKKDITGIDSTTNSVGTAVICTNTITPATPITSDTFTFTITGNQTVLQLIINPAPNAVNPVNMDTNSPADVYSIDGKRVKVNVLPSEITNELTNGIYIYKNKKIVINKSI